MKFSSASDVGVAIGIAVVETADAVVGIRIKVVTAPDTVEVENDVYWNRINNLNVHDAWYIEVGFQVVRHKDLGF